MPLKHNFIKKHKSGVHILIFLIKEDIDFYIVIKHTPYSEITHFIASSLKEQTIQDPAQRTLTVPASA